MYWFHNSESIRSNPAPAQAGDPATYLTDAPERLSGVGGKADIEWKSRHAVATAADIVRTCPASRRTGLREEGRKEERKGISTRGRSPTPASFSPALMDRLGLVNRWSIQAPKPHHPPEQRLRATPLKNGGACSCHGSPCKS